jgi:hypothetical protein
MDLCPSPRTVPAMSATTRHSVQSESDMALSALIAAAERK